MRKIFRTILIDVFFGLLLDVLFWFSGPYSNDSFITKFLWWISTPVAHILSWITGWPLKQEAGIALYVYAILITLPLLGLLLGLGFGIFRTTRSRTSD